MSNKRKLTAVIIAGIIAILAVITFFCSFQIIPTGYTGVRVTFGQINETPVHSGFNWKKPFVEKIQLINNKQQDVSFEGTTWAESSDQTVVYYENVTVTYQISADRSVWILANVENYKKNLVSDAIVASAIKSAAVLLPTDQVTNRNYIEAASMESLQNSLDEKYGAGTINVLQVIISNADFEDTYNAAIDAKSTAKQAYEQAQIDNQTKIEAAEAEATITKTAAQAEADARLIEAQAEADAILIEAEAQAEANRLLQESLSDEVLTQYLLEKWDGELPMVTSDMDSIFDLTSLLGE